MSGVTDTGFARERLDILLAKLQAALKASDVLGSDVVLDGTTPDGQIVGIIAEIKDDLLQLGEDVYNVVDPNIAIGAALVRLGLLCGITIKTGSLGMVVCNVHVKQGETLFAGAQIQDEVTNVTYRTIFDVGPSDADATVHSTIAQALSYGARALTTHSAKKAVDQYGWIDVSFAADGTTGVLPETEAQFRQRRTNSVAKPAQSITDAIYAALADLDGIGDVKVFNNPTSGYADIKPGDGAIPGHSCIVVARNPVVVSGVDKIAETIWLWRNPACDFVGSVNAYVTDSQGVSHRIGYYISAPLRLDVRLTYSPIKGEGFDGQEDEDALKAALVTWVQNNLKPGDDLPWAALVPAALAAVQGKSGGYSLRVESLHVGLHGGTLVAADIIMPFSQHASLSAADITLVRA